ncbi:aminotransferase class III-fold pyridoxal phosphate-dependent enzyme [Carboxylicivirga marina]|uniref:aminotransferase class III-fold pyridoxal phosphate-dependent enzyme n=1 Tax=Carboxylicivirga marina TaxID=2800988 RepID=UPI002591EED2|nr:aminotransferase class III-fold pyridoxal phosphate-dependent enzyme [uncultured Carboxylicivirga sp.]
MNKNELYKNYSRPLPAELMGFLKLDKCYFKAEKNKLYYRSGKSEVKVIDFVGGYGSNLLGHNHPQLVHYLQKLYQQKTPAFAQLSNRDSTGRLSERINDLIRDKSGRQYITTLFSTGSEAVEAAIKHAFMNHSARIEKFNKRLESKLLEIKAYNCWKKACYQQIPNKISFDSTEDFCSEITKTNLKVQENHPALFMASERSFHGKTTGASSITHHSGNPNLTSFNNIFFNWNEEKVLKLIKDNTYFMLLPELGRDGIIKIKRIQFNRIAGIIIEPILGEGGVRPVPHSFLKYLRQITKDNGIPLIFDEIQSGTYRTGEFLASFKANCYADYYILGKALGGGLSKISALVIDNEHYIEAFGLVQSSTFSEDDISSHIALKGLDILKKKSNFIIQTGQYFKSKLRELKVEFPDVITDIRGEGLILGISFRHFLFSQSYAFQILSRSGYWGYIIASYLLNKKNIRVSVSLSEPHTLRIHPCIYTTKNEIDFFVNSMKEICQILYFEDFYKLIDFLLPTDQQNLRDIQNHRRGNILMEKPFPQSNKVGFLVHYINLETIRKADPSIQVINDNTLQYLLNQLLLISCPILLGRINVSNKQGQYTSICFSGLPFTSRMINESLHSSDTLRPKYKKLCNDAISLLKEENGISTIGLGQYTSILLKNGKAVQDSNIYVTTGNSFTVFNSLQTIKVHLNAKRNKALKIGVIGAGGNISTLLSLYMTAYCRELLLLGNNNRFGNKAVTNANFILLQLMKHFRNGEIPHSLLEDQIFNSQLYANWLSNPSALNNSKLFELYTKEFTSLSHLKVGSGLNDCKTCDVVLVATNHPEPFLEPAHFKKDALICDLSVPSNCTRALLKHQDIEVVRGGIVALPGEETIPIKGFDLQKGEAYACISETLLLGLEKYDRHFSFGSISLEQVEEIGKIAIKHSFSSTKSSLDTYTNQHSATN